jgi:hypothetical protein
MGSGSDDYIYWHFFTIKVDYNSSHIELLLNDVCLTNLSLLSESWTGLYSSHSRMHCRLYLLGGRDRRHHVLEFVCSVVVLRESCTCINSQATAWLSVSNFQFSYPWKLCFVINWFPRNKFSVATYFPIRFLETAHMS